MKERRKILIIVLCAVLVLLVAGTVVFAEYTRSSRAKRVAISSGGGGMLFSSNYLSQGSEINNRYTAYASDAQSSTELYVRICNFVQGNEVRFYQKDIRYRLRAELVKIEMVEPSPGEEGAEAEPVTTPAAAADIPEDFEISISFNGGTAVVLDASTRSASIPSSPNFSTISRSGANWDFATVTFNPEAVANAAEGDSRIYLYLYTELEGTNSQYSDNSSVYPDLHNLRALFDAAVAGEVQSTSWTGHFNEPSSIFPSQLDGFNYVISGSGEGTIKLSWRKDLLQLNDYFRIIDLGLDTPPQIFEETVDNHVWCYILFDVDSDLVSRYDLQFFKAAGASAADFEDWETSATVNGQTTVIPLVNGYVKCEFPYPAPQTP